jgi:hypothetical protein
MKNPLEILTDKNYKVQLQLFWAINYFYQQYFIDIVAVRENYWPVASHWQNYYIMLYRVWVGFKLTTLVVIGTDYIGSKVMEQCFYISRFYINNFTYIIWVFSLISTICLIANWITTGCNRNQLPQFIVFNFSFFLFNF